MASAPRRPWWPAFASAACLAYFTLLLTSDIARPEPLGLEVAFEPDGLRVIEVDAGSAADRAGVLAGDRISRIGVVTIRRRIDALAADTHVTAGRPVAVVVERGGATESLSLVAPRASWRYWVRRQGAALLAVRGGQLATLVLACVLLLKRPRDRHAILGAWLLATVGIFSVTLPYGIGDTWRSLPQPIGAILFVPYVMSVPIAAVAFTFFAVFPRPLIGGARMWVAVWAPMLAALAWHVWYGWHLIYLPARVHLIADWSLVLVAISIGYGLALVAALVTSYRRLRDVNDRRRLEVLIAGALVGCVSGGPVAALYWIGPARDTATPLFASPLATMGALAFLAFPLSFAYAILRHRLFEVSVIIRRGLQYALARRVLVSVVPALAVLLAIDLLLHADRPLVESLEARGAIYLAFGVLAIIAHARREDWLDALDRRFFRERYNAQQILRRIVEDIRAGEVLDAMAARVVAQIHAALHPAFAALLARDPSGRAFRCLAAAPPDRAVEPLEAGTRLVALVGVLRRPADVSHTGSAWIHRELPEIEDAYLARNGIELIVPAGADALLALGAKQSEEPYSGEDADLLAAIGESLALRLGRDDRMRAIASSAFEECPQCGACYDTGTQACGHEGSALRTVPMPRTLANRYRLERRLGHGGMGTVYAATDAALSRRVAAKVLRDELVATAEAEERFQREARHAASLAHPNVVTVYDFGVCANRAFLVMELLEGATLREAMRATPALEPPRVLDILRGVCAAVDAAHERQLVHRDLKPENIFLSQTPRGDVVKVLDFGLAKTLAPAADWMAAPLVNTADGVMLGTLPYMAPEQLRGEPVTPASDLWALAVIAHEMLTGRHPFAGPAAWPAPAATAPFRALPAALADFFRRALSPNAPERPASAASFLDQLEGAVSAS